MCKKLIILLIVFLSSFLYGQQVSYSAPDTAWSFVMKYGMKTGSHYNAESEISNVVQINNRYIGVGSTKISSTSPSGAMFVAVDSSGKHLWDTVFTADSSHAGAALKLTDNSIISFGSTNNKLHIWKVSEIGTLIWDTLYQQYQTGTVRSVVCIQNNYLVACEGGVCKVMPDFTLQFLQTKDPVSSINLANSAYYAAGQKKDTIALLRIDTLLTTSKRTRIVYNLNKSQNPNEIMSYVNHTGFINNNRIFSIGSNDQLLRTRGATGVLQIDTNCTVYNYQYFKPSGWEMGWYAFAENESELVTAGETYSDCYIRKIKIENDSLLWEKKVNVSGYERIRYVKSTTDGGYIACGDLSDDPTAKNGGLIIKFKAPQKLHARNIVISKNNHCNTISSSLLRTGYTINVNSAPKQNKLKLNGQLINNSTKVKYLNRK